jgi:hypothetical protein
MHLRKMVRNTEYVGAAEDCTLAPTRLIRLAMYFVVGVLLGVGLWEILK